MPITGFCELSEEGLSGTAAAGFAAGFDTDPLPLTKTLDGVRRRRLQYRLPPFRRYDHDVVRISRLLGLQRTVMRARVLPHPDQSAPRCYFLKSDGLIWVRRSGDRRIIATNGHDAIFPGLIEPLKTRAQRYGPPPTQHIKLAVLDLDRRILSGPYDRRILRPKSPVRKPCS
ncbi:hypothetical protein BHE74_00034918 [Ensete ventricosum]|nr:hypothetical protein GW17_00051859 [Ensete ventricosum]RWW58277.1 hypothetical protein BHE74_00034918 [Ensete ventricosum]RZS13224.1 hypothetical protein BHM03_00044777 [Ensete ventricosum]